eukprot:Partr_v1_DN28633_c0_g1_i1_m49817 putative ATPase, class VI, type
MRTIHFQADHAGSEYGQHPELHNRTNAIRTSKYTLLTFLPKNLYEQFRRAANFFFLLLVLLQIIPEYRVVGLSVVATPLIIVVLATACKDAFEDYTRHVQDRKVNERIVMRLVSRNSIAADSLPLLSDYEDMEWQSVSWRNVHVGDLLMLRRDEAVPADMIILSTSEAECSCFVETMNLDGETNLKMRQGLAQTRDFKDTSDFRDFKCIVLSEDPHPDLSSYQGTVEFQSGSEIVPEKVSIDSYGILLRGTVLRNTEYCTGIVVSTGYDTKQILNAGETPSKQSELDKMMNRHITFNLVLMCAICLICSFGYVFWTMKYDGSTFMVGLQSSSYWFNGFVVFWGGLILYQNIVPISLYICIELVKSFQSYLINNDLDLYHEESDTPCSVKTWNISDNLGQIGYIFSDKTGTLTQNIMEFKRCSIGNRLYAGDLTEEDELVASKISSRVSLPTDSTWLLNGQSANKVAEINYGQYKKEIPRGWFDPELDSYLVDENLMATDHGRDIHEFLTLLSICHTVIVDASSSNSNGKLAYRAQSPDEACLVAMASENGYIFHGKKFDPENGGTMLMTVVNGMPVNYTLLNILDFDSDRKRMSVIVRCQMTGRITIYTKGADSVIYGLLQANQDAIVGETSRYLNNFAEEGLRTLCAAYREISSIEYEAWHLRYAQAMTVIYESAELRAIVMRHLNEEIERDLVLLGATGIEDKLQDGVPECISSVMKAGIKIWVLTGDKMETAINIGYLAGLLKGHHSEFGAAADMKVIRISDCSDAFEAHDALEMASREFAGYRSFALVIDGTSMLHVLENCDLASKFVQMACECKTVICCRVSPLQKAKVVELVMEHKKIVALAVGDGANDVSMIQAAHVGIGISGQEGMQAALSADFAIAQFRFLTKLLLVHGRWAYSRNSVMILNFYLKSLVFSVVIFWFQFHCGFSAAVIYEFTYMLFYNQVFTVLPIMILAAFDRDLESKILMEFPQVYAVDSVGQTFYTHKRFAAYLLDALWYSAVCYMVPVWTFGDTVTSQEGPAQGMYFIGTVMAVSAITAVNLSVALDTHSWVFIHHLTYWGSCLIFFVYVCLYSLRVDSTIHGMYEELFLQPTFWLCSILSVLIALGPRFLYYAIGRHFRPSDTQILEEFQSLDAKIQKKTIKVMQWDS